MSKSSFHLKGNLKHLFFALGLALNLSIVFSSSARELFIGLKKKPYRNVTGVLDGDINKSTSIKIVKIKTHEGLFLEVYSKHNHLSTHLLSRVKLPYSQDGYYHFSKTPSKLALFDINNDGNKEIVSTSFDSSLNGHLSFYSYDTHSQSLIPLTNSN